ncbi:hypothetical protein P353_16795 [Comamonas testosteroni]|uniref:HTH tetR-type domain-containing protein n=2 Tax=Comamonas testosteroni TaxID=285 RepID=A0A096FD91_COMTE|nr:hypothetical protein P353_16795 [Comamonas testosteroni]
MTKDERREQLLQVADEIVQAQGTDALTLITLAEHAGVSKPITYEHFSTREGLLSQLYRRYDDKVIAATRAAIDDKVKSLPEAARIAVEAYIECAVTVGPTYEAIVAALHAYPGQEALCNRIRDSFVEAYMAILEPLSNVSSTNSRLRFIALFGAVDAVARAVMLKEVNQEVAVKLLTEMIVGTLDCGD